MHVVDSASVIGANVVIAIVAVGVVVVVLVVVVVSAAVVVRVVSVAFVVSFSLLARSLSSTHPHPLSVVVPWLSTNLVTPMHGSKCGWAAEVLG